MRTFVMKAAPEWWVTAERLTKSNVDELADLCKGLKVEEQDAQDPSKTFVGINVPSRRGNRRLSEGDWLVGATNIDPYYTVLPDDIFRESYTEVKDGRYSHGQRDQESHS